MKTLDEVIAKLEDARVQVETGTGYWVDYRDNDKLKTDALHYLKEYQKILPLVPSLINTAIAVQKKGKTIG